MVMLTQKNERANAYIGKQGLFSLDQNGKRKPFSFGAQLQNDARCQHPERNCGIVAIHVWLKANQGYFAKQYTHLVERCAERIGVQLKMEGNSPLDSNAFLQAIVKEISKAVHGELIDQNYPDPKFLFDIPIGKNSDLYTLLIFDVWRSLGAPVGMAIGKDRMTMVLREGKIHKTAYVQKIVKNSKPWDKVVLSEMNAAQKSSLATIYDQSELQSALITIAADSAFFNKEYSRSTHLYGEAATLCPENAEARWKLGSSFFQNGEYVRALEECKEAIALEPGNWNAYIWAGNALTSLEKPYDAIDMYGKARDFASSRDEKSTAHFNIAFVLASNGQVHDAIDECTRAIEMDPKSASAYLLRSDLHYEIGMNDKGRQDRHAYEKLTSGKDTQDR